MKKDVSIENWLIRGTVFILIFTIGCFVWFQYQMSITDQYHSNYIVKTKHIDDLSQTGQRQIKDIEINSKETRTYPFIVECYEQPKCRGKKVTILQTTENLQDILDRSGFENGIASVRIVKLQGCPREGGVVTFYENPNFSGVTLSCDLESEVIVEEIPDYRAQILSIKIEV